MRGNDYSKRRINLLISFPINTLLLHIATYPRLIILLINYSCDFVLIQWSDMQIRSFSYSLLLMKKYNKIIEKVYISWFSTQKIDVACCYLSLTTKLDTKLTQLHWPYMQWSYMKANLHNHEYCWKLLKKHEGNNHRKCSYIAWTDIDP